MTKYLFLLGFSLCSISFMSGCKMSDFYSAPVANADSTPVADTDSALVADTDSAPVSAGAYTGIIYENFNYEAVSCSRAGMVKQLRGDVEPEGCNKGAFTHFIFFVEEEGETRDGFKFVHSFISDDEGTWRGAYLKVKKNSEY